MSDGGPVLILTDCPGRVALCPVRRWPLAADSCRWDDRAAAMREQVETSDQFPQVPAAQPMIRPLLFEMLASACAEMLTPHPSGCIIDEQS
jgi:hypothetical protein